MTREPLLPLGPDELLTTTRAVRRRLDLTRPVPDHLVRECVEVAMQAPSGSNRMTMQFVVVRDPELRQAIAAIYRECYEVYRGLDGVYIGSIDQGSTAANAQQQRSATSADHLADRLGDVPVLVIGCTRSRRVDALPAVAAAALFGNILPAMWSFMLAARARGLGTAWTTMHLSREREVAELLGIPYDRVQQACLTPLAYTVGAGFRPALRPAADEIIHWDRW